MKLSYITNSFAHTGGGLVGAVSGLVHGVQEFGHDVSVTAYSGAESADAWSGLSQYPIQAKRIGGVHWNGDLPQILNKLTPDLVHAHGLWLRSSGQNHQWCRGSKVPYVISPHGMLDPWAVKHSAWKKQLAGHWFEYAHLNDAACLHALGESEAASIRKFGQKNLVCVIPNGVTLPGVVDSFGSAPWKNTEGRKVLMFMGRIHPKKGLSLLLSAWKSLKEDCPRLVDEWCLSIAGWSEVGHREELEAQAGALGIANDIEFVGALHRAKKAAALHHASAFILPSYSEGLPMSILEAWSYRLPVLMTPECNLPEGFTEGAAIRLKTDPRSVEAGLRDLFEMSESQRLALGAKGYGLVEQQFVWGKIAEKMVSVYEWILGGGDAPECVRFD